MLFGSVTDGCCGRKSSVSPALYFGISFVGMVLLTLAAGAMTATPAAAAPPYEDLRNERSGLCIGAEGGSSADLARITQQTCSGSPSQGWIITDAGGGYVEVTLEHSGKCLSVNGNSLTPGARLVQWPCHDGPNQQFVKQDQADGSFRLVVRRSGQCVSVHYGSILPGQDLAQWHCNDVSGNGLFRLEDQTPISGAGGRWSDVIDLPLVPVAASALPNGKVLMWSAFDRYTYGGDRGYTQTAIFDPASATYSEQRVSNTGHDMFCPAIANLADGRVLVNGGSSASETSIYNPATDQWENGADMNIARGYAGSTLLSDGSVFTLGGSWSGGTGNKHGELWTEATGWQRLSGVPVNPFVGADREGVLRGDNHMWLFGYTNNRVFHAGPSKQMHWIDASGNGSVANAGARGSDNYAINGNAVMYEPGKILTTGGATAYITGTATTNATVIDLTGAAVTSRAVPSMTYRRGFHNSVVLPDGEVVVVGGQTTTEPFSDAGAILATEIWNPETETFRSVSDMEVPRTYHSLALLLPDARVLVGGGGLCGSGCEANHPDAQIYTPPNLLNDDGSDATRPSITSAPSTVDLGQRFDVTTNAAVDEFVLIRMSSVTHSVNNDQRRIPVSFTETGNLTYRAQAPGDGGVAIPGNYMLFAIDGAGVPSVASIVRVTTEIAQGDTEPPTVTFDFTDGAEQEIGTAIGGSVTDSQSQIVSVEYAIRDRATGDWVDDNGNPIGFSPASANLNNQAGNSADWTIPANLDPGDYDIRVRATDQAGVISDWVDRHIVLTPQLGEDGSVQGVVTDAAGSAVPGVNVDIFEMTADGSRGTFLGSTSTGSDGRYRFNVNPGCYVFTITAPDGETFNGSRWFQSSRCLDAGQTITDLDASLDGAGGLSFGGAVAFADGGAAEGVQVDLFRRAADGTRAEFLGTTRTAADGSYGFDVDAGCYVATFVAPDGNSFGGSRWDQASACVSGESSADDVDATLDRLADASLSGTVSVAGGDGVAGVKVTFFTTAADGSRGRFVGETLTGSDGSFEFGVTAGCHWLVFVAPDGRTFTNGSGFSEMFGCPAAGESMTGLDAVLRP